MRLLCVTCGRVEVMLERGGGARAGGNGNGGGGGGQREIFVSRLTIAGCFPRGVHSCASAGRGRHSAIPQTVKAWRVRFTTSDGPKGMTQLYI